MEDDIVCITCKQLALPGGETLEGKVHIIVEDGKISAIFDQEADLVKSTKTHYYADIVTPGFVDIHHHGLSGADDLVRFWSNPAYTQSRLIKYGVTSFLASMVFPKDLQSHSVFNTLKILEGIVGETGQGSTCEGIHAEGPIVNDFGGLPVGDNEMSIPDFKNILDAMPSCRIMTISPHVDAKNNYERIKMLLDRGIVPALGHDRLATEQEILGALKIKPSVQFHITHLFNVCSFHHRNPSLVNFGMTDRFPSLPGYEKLAPPTVEIIGDMVHVHPLAVSNVLSSRHFNQVAFVSDCTAEAIPNKKISYSNRDMTVTADGKCLVIEGTTTLAGSCCSCLDAFKSLVKMFHTGIGKAAAMVAENPARIANLKGIGSVKVGNRADLLLFDDDLNLQKTFVCGHPVYTAKEVE
ncbi:N-acetylglucosamine-6-phosphate deacetylase-like [Patiria miniata]|uniref:Amidohydrolase-related domain-containing protein n=1 Tax=Patiria miniata TaxID=46514 RepID=A0A913ZZW2_PATMI|nr:N-acetylglucosamine-6-phosphate deacetylase-like [Patiria miniata]XP_038057166.1 N-acetylglucosamine-6-phosphate deacetylase-like [Patiria miniata]XP_038057168.1 N-acetylglucosamine-6-phosphate deacetylase-like [Patiria miniata]